MPFPSDETTPPVTKTYLVLMRSPPSSRPVRLPANPTRCRPRSSPPRLLPPRSRVRPPATAAAPATPRARAATGAARPAHGASRPETRRCRGASGRPARRLGRRGWGSARKYEPLAVLRHGDLDRVGVRGRPGRQGVGQRRDPAPRPVEQGGEHPVHVLGRHQRLVALHVDVDVRRHLSGDLSDAVGPARGRPERSAWALRRPPDRLAIRSSSVATITRSTRRAAVAAFHTWTTMGTPARGARGLPGNRVEA